MPPLQYAIAGFIAGDKLNITRTVTGVPSGLTLDVAWLTIKRVATDPDPGVVQKRITPGAVSGVGQITNVGTGGTGGLLFELTMVDTGATLSAGRQYVYDIQLEFNNGDIATLEYGTFSLLRGVTDAGA